MKKIFSILSIGLLTIVTPSCEVVESVLQEVVTTTQEGEGLTNTDVISGLKEALNVGITNAVDVTSITDGFLKNSEIKIPFPESADKLKAKAEEWGLNSQVEKIVLTLNRAAEDAAKSATPIFVEAIKNMTIEDGFSILNGGNGAATEFLRRNTTNELVAAFSPKVQNSIEKVKLTEYWNPVALRYNMAMQLTGGRQVNTDLNQYVTEKAIDGLFKMVEKEENKIREDPMARVSDILVKVFGSISK